MRRSPARAGIDPQMPGIAHGAERFPRTRGDRPLTAPLAGAFFLGFFGVGSSVSKKSNDFTPEGLHNTTLSDVYRGFLA